jgi:uncharacterized protein (TIGR02145 family)
MKKKSFILSMAFAFALFLQCVFSIAQVPQKVSYQSVIRDATGELVKSSTVGMRISILQGSVTGTIVYVETHTVTTNVNGLATLEVGNGTTAPTNTFSAIDWSHSPFFLKVETDPAGGTNYTITGISEILSVPYALHAKTADSISANRTLDVNNNNITNVATPVNDKDAANKAYVDLLQSQINKLQNTIIAGGFVEDADGNRYNTVKIGTQVWMVENLKTTKYCNGDVIDTTNPDTLDIRNEATPKYQWPYDGNESNVNIYGRLYTWYTVTDSRGICPNGWHIPTDNEWAILTNSFGGEDIAGDKLKEIGSSHWKSSNTEVTNESGFTALPGGYHESDGESYGIGRVGIWRSRSVDEYNDEAAYVRYMHSDYNFAMRAVWPKKSGYSVRCIKDDNTTSAVVPTLSTTIANCITTTSASSGGTINNDGSAAVTSRGVCWSTNHNPTIADSKTTDGTGSGSFTSSISGITANTTYYLRAYATNSAGTGYGQEYIFKTYTGTVTDNDGNVYNTVTIGTQVWMVENLKTTHYNDGTSIPKVIDNTAWDGLTSGAYCWYNNDSATYCNTYGALYNWNTVKTGKLAPTGWHVPTDAEWTTLTDYLTNNGYGYGGSGIDIAKSMAATSGWNANTTAGNIGNDPASNNSSGFTALPGGFRYYDGSYYGIGYYGIWWSSTESNTYDAWSRDIDYEHSVVRSSYGSYEGGGFSVRCLRDN